MKPSLVLVLAHGALAVAGSAGAFTFADGTKAVCVARGEIVTEVNAEPEDPFKPQNRTAHAERKANGWQITWNMERLRGLPPEVRDFLFFHECAHARVPTENELEANCAGLLDMRAAGRAGPAFEAKLRRYFPADNAYWNDTFKCANASIVRPPPPPPPALPPPG